MALGAAKAELRALRRQAGGWRRAWHLCIALLTEAHQRGWSVNCFRGVDNDWRCIDFGGVAVATACCNETSSANCEQKTF